MDWIGLNGISVVWGKEHLYDANNASKSIKRECKIMKWICLFQKILLPLQQQICMLSTRPSINQAQQPLQPLGYNHHHIQHYQYQICNEITWKRAFLGVLQTKKKLSWLAFWPLESFVATSFFSCLRPKYSHVKNRFSWNLLSIMRF